MSRIEDALLRRQTEDIIYIGEVAERLYNGEGGELLRAICKGKQSESIATGEADLRVPADRTVGRVEAYENVVRAIEQAIEDGNELKAPIIEEQIEELN